MSLALDDTQQVDEAAREPRIDTTMVLLKDTWAARNLYPEGLVVGRKGTIVPRSQAAPLSVIKPGDSLPLPRVLANEEELGGPQFRIGRVLGEGGMGMVRSAEQVALAREVAIKGLREEIADELSEAQLLREARVTGALEHPNVVPVHVLGRDEAGRPIIVMKRIDGISWAQELAARPYARDSDGLARHLGILVQVARAVGFAHARGVLHRDLKPENVMIGGFGEIYLVDWGIAVALRPRAVRGIPLARDIDEIAGTPAYMAPEMVTAEGDRHSARTDVYLLGSILYEILTGAPPHQGATIREVLTNAFASKPLPLASEVPAALSAICTRAMQQDPAARYDSADAFREEIERFLLHRSSTELSDAAESRLATLREAVSSANHGESAVRQAIYGTFSECRFAFGHALEIWAGNEAARRGREQALQLMIDFELGHGSAGAAAAHLAELESPARELADRVEHAQRAEREREERLTTMEHESDVTASDSVRARLMFIAGTGWGVACLVAAILATQRPVTAAEFGWMNLPHTFVTAMAMLWYRREIIFNQVNRRLWGTLAWSWTGYLLMWPAVQVTNMEMRHALGVAMYACAITWGALTITLDRHFYPVPVANALGFVVAYLRPGWELACCSAAGFTGCYAVAFLWWRRAKAAAETRARDGSG